MQPYNCSKMLQDRARVSSVNSKLRYDDVIAVQQQEDYTCRDAPVLVPGLWHGSLSSSTKDSSESSPLFSPICSPDLRAGEILRNSIDALMIQCNAMRKYLDVLAMPAGPNSEYVQLSVFIDTLIRERSDLSDVDLQRLVTKHMLVSVNNTASFEPPPSRLSWSKLNELKRRIPCSRRRSAKRSPTETPFVSSLNLQYPNGKRAHSIPNEPSPPPTTSDAFVSHLKEDFSAINANYCFNPSGSDLFVTEMNQIPSTHDVQATNRFINKISRNENTQTISCSVAKSKSTDSMNFSHLDSFPFEDGNQYY